MTNKKRRNIFVSIVVIIVLAIAAWFGFGGPNKPQKEQTVTVGLVGSSKPQQIIWQSVAKTAKAKYNVNVKFKNFTDYNQPNKALKNGDIDLNSFQHQSFLKDWNKANHGGIVAIGKTYISPIRLYSSKYKKLSQLPDGSTIAIPNDPTNESRALFVLKNAGLIKLRSTKGLVTVADIKESDKNLKIKELGGEQCARVIDSVAAAVVNNDFATPAGLGKKQTIYVEPLNKDSQQWINVICSRSGETKNKAYQAVVKSFQTKKTKKLYQKYYGDTQISAWDTKLK